MRSKARLLVTLLGGFDARPRFGAPLALPTRKTRALVAYLAMPPGRAHRREKLAALLWGDMPDAQARGNLRQALSRLHKVWATAAAPGLLIQGDTVALDPAAIEVDVGAFERGVTDGRPGALEQAVAQYRGDLLEGLAVSERVFAEWLTAERERLRELAIKALERLLAHQRATGADDQALQTARRLLELDPLQEAVHRLVMRLQWRRGHRAAALRQYQLCVELLERELRAEPEAETRQLYQDILRPRRRHRPESPAAAAEVASAVVAPAGARAASEPATPLVGREAETTRLHALLDAVGGGSSRAVALVGEAGTGRTRLLEELAALADRRGLRCLVARSHETEQALQLGPWVEALRAGGVFDDLEVLAGLSPGLRADLARVLPELGNGPRGSVLRPNPLAVFTALARLVALAGARRPVVIVLDDFHWADEMSVRLLAFLGRRLNRSATLLAVSVRSEALAGAPLLRQTLEELSSEAQLEWTEVGPLSEADTLRLVRAVAGGQGNPEARDRIAPEVWRLAEGNPFVVLEAVRAWCAGGAPPLAELLLPDRVARAIVADLDRLDGGARQVASVGAVIGRDVDADLLLRASGLGDDEAVAGLESLMRAGILRRDDERLRFRHERVRVVAAGLLSAPRRALIHRRIAEGLEARSSPDRLPHRELGDHYRGAEAWDKALTHFREAGRQAAARLAYGDAAACFAEARDVCQRLSASTHVGAAGIDVEVELGSALHQLGDVDRALEHFRRAEAWSIAAGDHSRAARSLAALSDVHTSRGLYRTAIQLAHRALTAPSGGSDTPELWGWLRQSLVRASYAAGDYGTVVSVARATLDDLDGEPATLVFHTPLIPSVGLEGFLALALSALGQFEDALAAGGEAVRIAEKVSRSPELTWANYCLGRVMFEQGDAGQAVGYLERAFALTREWEPATTRRPSTAPRPFTEFAATALGLAHAAAGRLDSALDLTAAGVAAANARPFCLAGLLEIQGSVLLAAQRLDEAAATASTALETARAHGERGHEAWALRLLGDIARRQPVVGPAVDHFDSACALADRLQMRPLAARCRLERAEVLYRAGRHSEAAPSLRWAIEEFRAMEMTAWLGRAETLAEAPKTEPSRAIAPGRRAAFLREKPGS
jgi:DNA-binding SARP family transcriptional activator